VESEALTVTGGNVEFYSAAGPAASTAS
jgi:hypothetical protein